MAGTVFEFKLESCKRQQQEHNSLCRTSINTEMIYLQIKTIFLIIMMLVRNKQSFHLIQAQNFEKKNFFSHINWTHIFSGNSQILTELGSKALEGYSSKVNWKQCCSIVDSISYSIEKYKKF